MEPNASVTVSYTVPNNTWKNDGTNLVRLRFTFKRQGRFVKTNLIVHRKDMVGQRIKNSDIRRKAEELIERMEKAISHLDCFALQSMTIDQVVQFVVEDDEGFKLGRAWWIEELGKGNYLLPIGGNDAHGDLNDTTFVDLPLLSLGYNRHHVFGKVRTVVAAASSTPTLQSLRESFKGDNCYITDGPALWWERSGAAIVFHAHRRTCTIRLPSYCRLRLPAGRMRNRQRTFRPHLCSNYFLKQKAQPITSAGLPFFCVAITRWHVPQSCKLRSRRQPSAARIPSLHPDSAFPPVSGCPLP